MVISKRKITIVFVHLLLWAVFLSLPAIFNPRRYGFGIRRFVDDLMEPPRLSNALLLIGVFYLNYYLVIPRLYFTRKYSLLFLSVVIAFGLFFLLNYSMMPPELKNPHGGGMAHWPFHDGPPQGGGINLLGNSFNLFMFIIVYATSFAYCLYEQWQIARQEQLNAEISFLKGQINPHFLFNTLNSIYSMTLSKSDDAPDAVIKLSGMMRYAVSEAHFDYVPLAKEIAYIENYIELQKLRLTAPVGLNFELSGDAAGLKIAPFLITPFIENAFKYGVNPEENSDIRISIDINDTVVNLQVWNNKVFVKQNSDIKYGLGTRATRQRLQLLYPGRHTLTIDDNVNDFRVLLQIRL